MARSQKRRSRPGSRRRGVTPAETEARIAELRKRRVPSRSAREDLDGPLDPRLVVETELPFHRLKLAVGGEEVSGLTVVDFRQQIGSQTVRMGGIAGVGTHRDHRFRGYARRLLDSALRWMRREGFATTMLYGIPSFYPKFGFAQAFAGVEFSMAARDTERVRAMGFRLVKFAPAHLSAVLRMYHRNNAGRTGPTRRDREHWRPFRKGIHFGSKATAKVALDARGRPVGYLVHHDEYLRATVIEADWATPRVWPDLLRAAGRLAIRQRMEYVRFILPEDDALMEYAKPLGYRKTTRYRAESDAQVRMIDVASALGSVAGELASRTAGRGGLTLRTNLDDVSLSWSDGELRVGPPKRVGPQGRLPQWALAQLLYGYRSAEALRAAGVLRASAAAEEILAELFPVRPHFHYPVDQF